MHLCTSYDKFVKFACSCLKSWQTLQLARKLKALLVYKAHPGDTDPQSHLKQLAEARPLIKSKTAKCKQATRGRSKQAAYKMRAVLLLFTTLVHEMHLASAEESSVLRNAQVKEDWLLWEDDL